MNDTDGGFRPSCPIPAGGDDTVQMAHGGGGRAMARLIDEVIRPAFADPALDRRHDGAVLDVTGPLAFTTDTAQAIRSSLVVFIAVQTPPRPDGAAGRRTPGSRPRPAASPAAGRLPGGPTEASARP